MTFDQLDLDYDVLDAIEEMGFENMTPVQEATIPVILDGDDLIGCAQTGTGKTAAYALPLLSMLMDARNSSNYDSSKVKSIIMVPTRELAMQIDTQLQGFSYYLPISSTAVYGGGDGKTWDVQRKGLSSGAEIVVATPGRLLAHLEGGAIDLSGVEHFILDEADRMLDMGFFDDIMKVINRTPKSRQTILFSATLPPKIRQLSKQILNEPVEINIAISKPSESIDQSIYVCYESQKMGIVRHIFDGNDDKEKSIIFSSSKLKVKDLTYQFKRMKLNVGAMHSDLEQSKREEVMLAFKSGRINILVATDIVARGIDIDDIATVINYDVPHDPEDYIHRIGRTGRASATGRAITFVSEAEQGKFHRIEEFIEKDLKQLEIPTELGEGPAYRPDINNGNRRGGNSGGAKRGGSKSKKRDNGGKAPKANSTESKPVVQAEDIVVAAAPQPKDGEVQKKRRPKRRFNKKPKEGAPTGETKPQTTEGPSN